MIHDLVIQAQSPTPGLGQSQGWHIAEPVMSVSSPDRMGMTHPCCRGRWQEGVWKGSVKFVLHGGDP